jgi:hypothetical protein
MDIENAVNNGTELLIAYTLIHFSPYVSFLNAEYELEVVPFILQRVPVIGLYVRKDNHLCRVINPPLYMFERF